MPLQETLRRQAKWLVLIEAFALVGAIGWIDHVTGWEWSFFVFYAFPIVMVVRRTDQRLGFAFAVLCTIAWWAAQVGSNPYQTAWAFGLAVATRLFYFAIVVVAAASVKARRILDRERIETLERTQKLEREILRASEQEQQRIGRDLHDGLQPHLAAIGLAVSLLKDDAQARGQLDETKIDQIREMVTEAITLTRDLARGLFPVQMDGAGLSVALEHLVQATARLTGMSVSFYESGDTQIDDSEDGTHLYRIAQEAVNNAVKHGGATNVTILLTRGPDFIRLLIADDGKGMASTQPGSNGVGLHSMRYRARVLGGELEFKSEEGGGTTVTCQIPVRTSTSSSIS